MIIEEIPYHLRNTITEVDCPIYFGLEGDVCRPPARLALGDTLMLLGVLRNHGRPVKLHLDPGPIRPLVESHPMVAELAAPEPGGGDKVHAVAVRRFGRKVAWHSDKVQRAKIPVLPVDLVRANPILGHSLHYKLASQNDRPGLYVDPEACRGLNHLLAKRRPTLVVYPINPGRDDPFWADEQWWAALLGQLGKIFALVAVGAPDYGGLTDLVDEALPSHDPASRLEDLATLIRRSAGFVGVDGGLSHLAAAVNRNLVTVWDAMTSYRHWAGSTGHHIVMSNPHGFRYPQSRRLDLEDFIRHFRRVNLAEAGGEDRVVELPVKGFKAKVREVFGSFPNYAMLVQSRREIAEERGCVSAWMASPDHKSEFYRQSLNLALSALAGQAKPGANWVAPVMP